MLWPYAVAGLVSWIGVALAGLPPELGLLPLLPAIPHADRSFGLFAEADADVRAYADQLSRSDPPDLVLFYDGGNDVV